MSISITVRNHKDRHYKQLEWLNTILGQALASPISAGYNQSPAGSTTVKRTSFFTLPLGGKEIVKLNKCLTKSNEDKI